MAKKTAANEDRGEKDKGTFYVVRKPTIGIIKVPIVGTDPLLIHGWSEKARRKMLEAQQAEKGMRARTPREKRDPVADFNGARLIYRDAKKKIEWDGIAAVAFKASLVGACRQIDGLAMTDAKRMIFVRADGSTLYHSPYSTRTEIGLVRIYGTAEMREDAVRINNGKSTDLAYRPQYWPWSAVLQIEFNASMLKPDAILNLVQTAGYFEGVGEWRPGSKESYSGQLGRWEVDDSKVIG